MGIKWIKIDYDVVPAKLFKKYGIKPFEIMDKKARKDGEVWNNISYFDSIKAAEERGYRLPNIREILLLLEHYKNTNKSVSIYDKGFLGIKELSYNEDVCYEWIYILPDAAAIRGGDGGDGALAGVFAFDVGDAPSSWVGSFGFRCCR